MSSYSSSESRRVTPRVHGSGFDTARRKRAAPHIFEHVREDALARLFRKAGDAKAEERARSVFAAAASFEPGETARALMALRQRKKDKLLRIAGAVRRFLGVR